MKKRCLLFILIIFNVQLFSIERNFSLSPLINKENISDNFYYLSKMPIVEFDSILIDCKEVDVWNQLVAQEQFEKNQESLRRIEQTVFQMLMKYYFDIDLVKEVHPDVVYISNHGGIRTKNDVKTALFYGANKVVAARSFIRGTFDNNYSSIVEKLI